MGSRRYQAGPEKSRIQWGYARRAGLRVVYGILIMLGAAAFIVLLFTSGKPY